MNADSNGMNFIPSGFTPGLLANNQNNNTVNKGENDYNYEINIDPINKSKSQS